MPTTRLDAINTCLRGVGLSPVSTEESGSEAADALATVNQASRSVQAVGWWFNKEYNWKLTPDSVGKIDVPQNVIDINEWNASRECSLTVRGDFIYDTYNHTYDLSDLVNADGKIEFVFAVEIPFNDLPEPARLAIMFRAKRMFAQDEESDTTTHNMQSRDEAQAMVELVRLNSKHLKRNAFHNSRNAHKLSLIGGHNSGAVYSPVFPRRNTT
jgi:hypothetical protein